MNGRRRITFVHKVVTRGESAPCGAPPNGWWALAPPRVVLFPALAWAVRGARVQRNTWFPDGSKGGEYGPPQNFAPNPTEGVFGGRAGWGSA